MEICLPECKYEECPLAGCPEDTTACIPACAGHVDECYECNLDTLADYAYVVSDPYGTLWKCLHS